MASQAQSPVLTIVPGVQAITIHPGENNVRLPVSLSGYDGATGPVRVTLAGLPSGITFSPITLVPGTSGTLLLNASVAADQEAFPGNDPAEPDTATTQVTVVAASGSLYGVTSVSLTVSLQDSTFSPKPEDITLPIVRIDTGGTPILSKTTDVSGTITITSADGQIAFLPGTAGLDNTATFHLHGNSTALLPKKPYNIKLSTSADLLQSMGLSCPYVTSTGKPVCDKSKSYILLANYSDKTMLRDWSASALANAIPAGGDYLSSPSKAPSPSGTSTLMPWAPHSLFVELFLNGEYEGTYQLIESVKVDSHRVNINSMSQNVTADALTGGYLMEIDQRQDEDFVFITPHSVYVGLTDPDSVPEVPEQTAYIQNYVSSAETALFSKNYTDQAGGWRSYFDEASAVNYYIVNDLLGNWDSARFYSSVYLYKDKNNPLLYMGPVWDFDISSGNVNGTPILDPLTPWMQNQSPWYAQLFSDPSFKASAARQWNALKANGVLDAWVASIAQQAAALEQTQVNNFRRWPMQGIRIWPNAVAPGSYDGEVGYFTSWIKLRMGYIDSFLNTKPPVSVTMSVPTGNIRRGTPVTLTAKVSGDNPTGSVIFSYSAIVLGASPVDASGNASLTVNSFGVGPHYLAAFYNGDDRNGMSGVVGPLVNVLPPLADTFTDLLASASAIDYGSTVSLTAVTIPNSGTTPATGTITFTSNGDLLGSSPVDDRGEAGLFTTSLPLGANSIQAVYSGDLTHSSSISNVGLIVVNPLPPGLIFMSVPTHSIGDAFQLSSKSNSPAAAVYSVVSGPAKLSGNSLTCTGAGQVVLQVSQAATGHYSAASSQISFMVESLRTTTTMQLLSSKITYPLPLVFEAAVLHPGKLHPSGTLRILDGASIIATYPVLPILDGHVFGFTLAPLDPGQHTITAEFSGDAEYATSTSTATVVSVASRNQHK